MAAQRKLYLPKEHGSWGMFFIPLVLGLLTGGFGGWGGALFLMSASALFLLREPFLTAWRLFRRRQQVPGELRSTIALYAVTAAVTGLGAASLRPLLMPLGAAAVAALAANGELAMRGKGRTVLTEVAAIVLPVGTAAAAYYVGTGRWDTTAWTLWALAALYFVSSVFYVKLRVQAAHVRPGSNPAAARRDCALYHAIAVLALACGIAFRWWPVLAVAPFLPVLARAVWAVIAVPRTLNLKRIGWTEVAFSIFFLAAVAAAMRPT